MGRNVFTQKAGNLWSSLPQKEVEAKTLNVFKKELATVLGAKGISRLSISSKKLRQRGILRTIFCCLAHGEDDGEQALGNRNNNTSQLPSSKNSTTQ
eukprot:g24917.t1